MKEGKTLELAPSANGEEERNATLVAFGERLRMLRARRGLTRKAVAEAAEVSERYLANLEQGVGNPSLLILGQVAGALRCPVAELIGDMTTVSAEWLLIRELLAGREEGDLRRARLAIGEAIDGPGDGPAKGRRLALIGLRGAGKSTLGLMLAEALNLPFVELSAEIERIACCSIREIHDLYGPTAYRRYERRALEEVLQRYPDVVIATPGGLVSEAATFNLLLTHSTTVWLQASPEDHMARVAKQGDLRPMAASSEAMADLRRILDGRATFYSKADLSLDTSARALPETFELLLDTVRRSMGLAASGA